MVLWSVPDLFHTITDIAHAAQTHTQALARLNDCQSKGFWGLPEEVLNWPDSN